MAMSSAALTTELQGLSMYTVEIDAINAWVTAFSTYFEDASSNGVPIVVAALIPAEAAMAGAMTGLSTAASNAIQAGILAFWGAIIPAVAWPTVLAIVPPTLLSGLSVTLDAVFLSNTNGSLDKNTSMAAIATVIHTANLGGIATWPTPGPGPQPII